MVDGYCVRVVVWKEKDAEVQPLPKPSELALHKAPPKRMIPRPQEEEREFTEVRINKDEAAKALQENPIVGFCGSCRFTSGSCTTGGGGTR